MEILKHSEESIEEPSVPLLEYTGDYIDFEEIKATFDFMNLIEQYIIYLRWNDKILTEQEKTDIIMKINRLKNKKNKETHTYNQVFSDFLKKSNANVLEEE